MRDTIKTGKVNGKILKVSLNNKKCTNVSGRALHQCKKAHCVKLAYATRKKKLTVRVCLHVTRAREKHSYETGIQSGQTANDSSC